MNLIRLYIPNFYFMYTNIKALSNKDNPISHPLSEDVKVVDIFLQLEIDFQKKILVGSVTLTVERTNESATHLVSSCFE